VIKLHIDNFRLCGGVPLCYVFVNNKSKAGSKQMIKAGFEGTFVISWSQTEIDGLRAASVQSLTTGAAWQWRGEAIRVDGPNDILRLGQAEGAEDLRKRASRMVHRLVGDALDFETIDPGDTEADILNETPLMDNSFVVTDGRHSYAVTLIDVGAGRAPLLMFVDVLPPRDRDLWIVHHSLQKPASDADQGGVICFTPGTRIRTPLGLKLIEDLREGDFVDTKDNGAQRIRWIGSRHLSGGRLFSAPMLRPIRINAGIFGAGTPDQRLVVSPEHRIIIRGPIAQDLFNTPEVLVAAKDLVDGQAIAVDTTARDVTYVHLLFDQHQVMWANGVETESFHPASAALASLDVQDRARLSGMYPELEADPYQYGTYARRNLTTSEAAILKHAA